MTEVQVHVQDPNPPRGVQAQDLAALGAQLGGHGLTSQQVAGLLARVQKVAEQAAIRSLSEVLDDVRRIQEARLWRLLNLVQTLNSYGGLIHRNSVIMAINGIITETPRQ